MAGKKIPSNVLIDLNLNGSACCLLPVSDSMQSLAIGNKELGVTSGEFDLYIIGLSFGLHSSEPNLQYWTIMPVFGWQALRCG